MKYIAVVLAVMASPAAMSVQMEGFGANYYLDDSSVHEYDTHRVISPRVIVGDRMFVMEYSMLTDIAETTDVTVNKGEQASWFCLSSEGVNYWFISDNEMGQGDLTSIAIDRNQRAKGCDSYSGYLNVTISGLPLLNMTRQKIQSIFPVDSGENIIKYCNDTRVYGDFTQMNCLQYNFKAKKLEGVIMSQVTSD